ncbi:MAG: hypothetical protein M0Z52_13405 [Actinomycetota bacterium]|nr:hypothetical protein [Actinomycetota bacterium]
MNWTALLIAVHVVTILLWIGGVAFVTLIIFPIIATTGDSLEQVLLFQRVEHRFARHARIYIALSGITGFWLLHMLGMDRILFTRQTIGVSIMLFAWFFYLLVLLFEKRIFKKLFGKPDRFDSAKVFKFLAAFHWVVLGISLLAVFAGVWQGHGGSL